MSLVRPIPVLAVAAALLGCTAVSSESQTELPPTGFEEGEPFPTLALPTLEEGEPRSLAEFRGHKVVLHVFASW